MNNLSNSFVEKQLNDVCLKTLQKCGDAIIIGAISEAELIANIYKENELAIYEICYNTKAKSENLFCGINFIHTTSLPERFKKARFIIASKHIQNCMEQLISLSHNQFYSPLKLSLKKKQCRKNIDI